MAQTVHVGHGIALFLRRWEAPISCMLVKASAQHRQTF